MFMKNIFYGRVYVRAIYTPNVNILNNVNFLSHVSSFTFKVRYYVCAGKKLLLLALCTCIQILEYDKIKLFHFTYFCPLWLPIISSITPVNTSKSPDQKNTHIVHRGTIHSSLNSF